MLTHFWHFLRVFISKVLLVVLSEGLLFMAPVCCFGDAM